MKTRFKTSSKSQKQSILENSNFLNNQNYILGKNKKKGIFSEYLTLNKIKYFYKILNYLLKLFYNILFIFILLIFLLVYFYNKSIFDSANFMMKIFFLIMPISYLIIIFFIAQKLSITKIDSIKSYFLNDGNNELIGVFSNFLGFLVTLLFPITLYIIFNKIYGYTFEFDGMKLLPLVILPGIFFSIFFIALFSNYIKKMRYFNLLLLPFFLLYIILFYLFYYIKNTIYKNKVKIYKFNINSEEFDNFIILKKNENKIQNIT